MTERLDKLLTDKTEGEKSIGVLVNDIENLLSVESHSGQESELRDRLGQILKRFGCETKVDSKGNLWAESNDKEEGSIILNAHLDRVGPGTIKRDKERLVGRLDDTLGISIILALLREGFRPSILFTVEEESAMEVIEDGIKKLKDRELPGGIYNAGARHAADELWASQNKPKLLITIDVTTLGKPGDGPAIYTSSGLHTPGKQFYFKPEIMKEIAKVVNPEHIGVRYVEGNANDSIEFTFVPDIGVTAVEVPIENPHSNEETAHIDDIEKTLKVIRVILEKAKQI